MIRIEHLDKKYKTVHALKAVSLHISKGELFAYLGPNGAGKTTTIRMLTGLTQPSSGTALLNGYDIAKDVLSAKQQFGLVPQTVNLDQELTVSENLNIHGQLYRMTRKNILKRIEDILSYVELPDYRDALVKTLSGGMKRRLMIARALMHEPPILFLDEPTVGLDAKIRRKVWALIKKIQQNSTTIFLTTHYIEEAEFLAHRVAFLDKGSIVTVDSPRNLIDRKGKWAIDRISDDKLDTLYFASRKEAESFNTNGDAQYILRRVNLEDAFIGMTGEKTVSTGEFSSTQPSGKKTHGSHGGHGAHETQGKNEGNSKH
ncbi:MAG: ABC transporter ATP-binding protein [Thermodesulfobacteriota bacterium]|nr:ABC transporter ATP-binding protein [Thermodesulfobacteriota bacterium]